MSKTSKQQIIQHLIDLMATIANIHYKGRETGSLWVHENGEAGVSIDLYNFGGDGKPVCEGLTFHKAGKDNLQRAFCICYNPDWENGQLNILCYEDFQEDYDFEALPEELPADVLQSITSWLEKSMQPSAPDKPNNDVSSFFYYMWNAWSKEECKTVFGNMWEHFWSKWMGAYERMNGPRGAAEVFYAELSKRNRGLLVKRATDVYDEDGYYKLDD